MTIMKLINLSIVWVIYFHHNIFCFILFCKEHNIKLYLLYIYLWAVSCINKFIYIWLPYVEGTNHFNGSFRPWNHSTICVALTVLGFPRFKILGTVLVVVWLTGREDLFTDAGCAAKHCLFVDVLIKQEVNGWLSFNLMYGWLEKRLIYYYSAHQTSLKSN